MGPELGPGSLPPILPPTNIWKLKLGDSENGSHRVRSIVWGVQQPLRGLGSARQDSQGFIVKVSLREDGGRALSQKWLWDLLVLLS